MTEDARLREIDRLFAAALDLPTDRRIAFVEKHCEGDPELLGQVRALIDEARQAPDLEGPGRDILHAALRELARQPPRR